MRKTTTRDYEPADYPKFDIGDLVIENIKDDIKMLEEENNKLNLKYDNIVGSIITMFIVLILFSVYFMFKTQ